MVSDAFLSLADWTSGAGWVGVAAFALAFVVATLALVPAAPLTAIAGFTFGSGWGTLLISPLGVLVALLAFLIGRSVARPWVQRRLAQRPRMAAVDAAIGRAGFRIVFLLRLSSVVPFAPLSYALGSSQVCARDYVLASWLGLLPGTFLYVYLGSLAGSVGQLLKGRQGAGDAGLMFSVVGFAAAVMALVLSVRIARSALNTAIDRVPGREDQSPSRLPL